MHLLGVVCLAWLVLCWSVVIHTAIARRRKKVIYIDERLYAAWRRRAAAAGQTVSQWLMSATKENLR